MGCRKSLARLTPAERTAFVNAVLALKASGRYDVYNAIHAMTMDPGGVMVHNMPLFFPWHRQLILMYERDLQSIDSSVSLPYWDWSVANVNGAGTESLIWRSDFMGSPGNPGNPGPVTGPFAAWGFTRNAFNPFQYPGTGGNIATAMVQPTYYPFESGIEGPHGAAHVWVGGDMADVMTSPHDPTFFLLHCNVDRLWAEWIRTHQSTPGFQPYLPTTGGMAGQNFTDSMWPWDGSARPMAMAPWSTAPIIVRPEDLVDHRALGYFYDTIDPECAPKPTKESHKDVAKEIHKEFFKEVAKEVIKEHKEFLKEHKELIKEHKEISKETIKEHKETMKEGIKEFKDKELKEKDKDLVDGGKGLVEKGGAEGGHFIPPALRPDLSTGALSNEPGSSGGGAAGMRSGGQGM